MFDTTGHFTFENGHFCENRTSVPHPVLVHISTAVLGLTGSLGTICNFFSMIMILSSKDLRIKPISILVVNLAFTDLLYCLLVIPTYLTYNVVSSVQEALGGELNFCIFNGCFRTLSCIEDWVTVATIALERYCRICQPFYYRKYFNTKKTLFIVIGTWILCTLWVYSTYCELLGSLIFEVHGATCIFEYENQLHKTIFWIIFAVIPMIVVTLCYYKIYKKLHASKKWRESTGQRIPHSVFQNELCAAKASFLTSVLFLICVSPMTVYGIVDYCRGYGNFRLVVLCIYWQMLYLNNIIYMLSIPPYRQLCFESYKSFNTVMFTK